jgi:ABC-type multidrug transport system fused ATPase/permease subunit
MDEATSALEDSNSRKIYSAIEEIMEDKTAIVISHRLSTISRCSRILVLERGMLVEEGTYDDLKRRKGGLFVQLVLGMRKGKKI